MAMIKRQRVQRLMRSMGLAGMAPGSNMSKAHPEHKVYPYLLRGRTRGAAESEVPAGNDKGLQAEACNPLIYCEYLVPLAGIELATFTLRMCCSTN
jgi:hypothetical protein